MLFPQTQYELIAFKGESPTLMVGFFNLENAILTAREMSPRFTRIDIVDLGDVLNPQPTLFMRWSKRPKWVIEETFNQDGDSFSTRLI